jgi:hypothetical protein
MRKTALAGALFCIQAQLWAASPVVSMIAPAGGQRGSEFECVVSGQRLGDAKGLLFYEPGIEVTAITPNGDGSAKAKLKIAADCALGEHQVRLWTATGISNLMVFYVGPFPNVAEVKPDRDIAHAQPIALNTTVNGVIEDEQIAYFSVVAKKGQRLTAEVEGMRLGLTMFDPWVAIETDKGKWLKANDDNSLLLQDPLASVIVPEDGTYMIAVRDSVWGGSANSLFRLHVGTFPQPLVVYPPGGQTGENLALHFIGDAAGPIDKTIQLPAEPSNSFPVFAETDGLTAPAANNIRVSPFPNVLEVKPNNDREHATVADKPLPLAFNGIISQKGESGFFKFKAKKDDQLDVAVYARRLQSPLDSVVAIYNSNGNQIADNDDSAGLDSYLRFHVPADGDYYLSVRDQLRRGGPAFTYRVEVTPVHPDLALAIPEIVKDSQERQTIVVPKGNRYATVIRAQRSDFDGAFTLDAEGLPPGVTFTAGTPDGDVVPVVFEAAPEAATGGALAALGAHGNDAAKSINGHYEQNVALVLGQPNNSIYLSTSVHKLAVAVADAAPFKIEIAEPKLTIPQSSAMELKVVATRDPGFTAPITVSLLQSPSGLSAAGSVTIPTGQTEGVIPLNTSDSARLRTWKVAVIASADAGKGPVWVASKFVDVEVQKPPVTAQIARASTEQGKPATVICTLTQNAPFTGTAKAELLGLPNKAVAKECEITSADKEIRFDVTTDPTTPAGRHHDLFCRLTFENGGEKIVESTGQGGVLRVDRPAAKEMAAK